MTICRFTVLPWKLFLGGLLLACLIAGGAAADDSAGDWPQYRYDAQRSAATPHGLPAEMDLLWVRELPSPRPAFPDEQRLRFDRSYDPVVLGGTLYVASMVTDSVTAVDTATGRERWVYFADAPIRFAPAAGQGRVFVACDDGYLHCLDAATGRLQWKFRGAPEDRRERLVFGSGRLISLWPARGGPVLDGEVVYFAAGIWPSDGVFVHAVDATSGRAIWSNTTADRIEQANVDHGINQDAGITPQGYLARIHDHLVVPCGAQLPAFFDPQSGRLGPYTTGWGGRVGLPKGTWFAAGGGRYMNHGGDLYDVSRPADDEDDGQHIKKYMSSEMRGRMYAGQWTRLMIDPTNQRELGNFRQGVITAEALYLNRDGAITALDLTDVELVPRDQVELPQYRDNDLYPDKWVGKLQTLWRLPVQRKERVHIKAGGRLYSGAAGRIQAIDIPDAGGSPQVSWQAEIEGTPHSMLAADDKLFVTTTDGRLYAFGTGGPATPIESPLPSAAALPQDELAAAAVRRLDAAGADEGYALLLGLTDGRLLEQLVARSQLHVIAVDQDAERVDRLRRRLHDAGLYGTRATVLHGDPLRHPLPPFMADLVTTEDAGRLVDRWTPETLQALVHSLRPYGGTAYLPADDEAIESLAEAHGKAELPEVTLNRIDHAVLLARPDGLPESAAWSHEAGDAANAAASRDRFVKAPLGMLWFDSSFRWHRKPGSALVRVAGGRVFVKSDRLNATDAFTGRHLWTAELPNRFAGGSVEMVAVDDRVYLAQGKEPCRVHDAATGRQVEEIGIPEGLDGNWANLRIEGPRMVYTIGRTLICADRHSGEVAWTLQCDRPELSVAIGREKVYCAEVLNRRRGGDAEQAGTKLRAVDIESGRELWQVPCGHEIRYASELDWIVTAGGIFDAADGRRVGDGAETPQIAGTNLVSGTKDELTLLSLTATDSVGRHLEWDRRGCTEMRVSTNLVTTRYKANAAYIDLGSLEITPIWNIRPGCGNANNLIPADGLLNVPNVTGGCECNYTPVSQALVPQAIISRWPGE